MWHKKLGYFPQQLPGQDVPNNSPLCHGTVFWPTQEGVEEEVGCIL
jgi:hypothetical protein